MPILSRFRSVPIQAPIPLLSRYLNNPSPLRSLRKPFSRCRAISAAAVAPAAAVEKFGSKQVVCLTPQIYDYVLSNVREPEILRELREETASMKGSQMQVLVMVATSSKGKAPIEPSFNEYDCDPTSNATSIFEFEKGYSSLAVALALPESGCLVACERDKKCLEIAKKYYERAGVSHKVDVKHALAADTLRSLILNGEAYSYDFAFVDAEKRMYEEYFELLLQLVRMGGLIVIDNVLWHGKVADLQVTDPKTISIRNFNKKILEDKRVNISMVPIGDGMTICRKISHS